MLALGPRRRRCNDAEWGAAVGLKSVGLTEEHIALKLGRGRSVVYNLLRAKAPPSAAPPPKRKLTASAKKRRQLVKQLITKRAVKKGVKKVFARGRPRKDPKWQRPYNEITTDIIVFPYGSTRRVSRELGRRGIKTSRTTVKRDVDALHLFVISRGKRQFLTAEQQQRRVSIFKPLIRKSHDWFHGLVFSDEKIFDSNSHGNKFQYVGDVSERIPLHQAQYPTKVHVWGAIGVGWRKLVVFDEEQNVTTEVYQAKCLTPVLRRLKGATAFMHDGAGVHKAAEAWLKRNKVTVLVWPASSPDGNPIENLWGLLAEAVAAKGPWGREQLVDFIVEAWNEIAQSVIDNLVLSFKRRCQAIVAAEGRAVKMPHSAARVSGADE